MNTSKFNSNYSACFYKQILNKSAHTFGKLTAVLCRLIIIIEMDKHKYERRWKLIRCSFIGVWHFADVSASMHLLCLCSNCGKTHKSSIQPIYKRNVTAEDYINEQKNTQTRTRSQIDAFIGKRKYTQSSEQKCVLFHFWLRVNCCSLSHVIRNCCTHWKRLISIVHFSIYTSST